MIRDVDMLSRSRASSPMRTNAVTVRTTLANGESRKATGVSVFGCLLVARPPGHGHASIVAALASFRVSPLLSHPYMHRSYTIVCQREWFSRPPSPSLDAASAFHSEFLRKEPTMKAIPYQTPRVPTRLRTRRSPRRRHTRWHHWRLSASLTQQCAACTTYGRGAHTVCPRRRSLWGEASPRSSTPIVISVADYEVGKRLSLIVV